MFYGKVSIVKLRCFFGVFNCLNQQWQIGESKNTIFFIGRIIGTEVKSMEDDASKYEWLLHIADVW